MNRGVRYVHNTVGEYVAFVVGGHLFTPGCSWLGIVDDGREVYNTEGMYIGELQPDDRLVRSLVAQLPKQVLRPQVPLVPVRPLPARRRLFMPAVPPSYEDVFQGTRRTLTFLTSLHRLAELNDLSGAALVAGDGTFLGRVSHDPTDAESLAPVDGAFGSPHAEHSIFNPTGVYGSEESPLSSYHPTTATPPRIERDGETLAWLSANRELPRRVHPDELVTWLKLG